MSTWNRKALVIPNGTRFNMLTVLEETEHIGKTRAFLCRCDCGKVKAVCLRNLGAQQSCGCLIYKRRAFNEYTFGSDQEVTVKLTRGYSTVIDVEDLPLVQPYLWYVDIPRHSCIYARATVNHKPLKLHRLILGCDSSLFVDHKDGNGLNNRRSNLRTATHYENARNRKLNVRSSTGKKGVIKLLNAYLARIVVNGKQLYIGRYSTADAAARAYDEAALLYHGEFARLNNPAQQR